MSATSPPASERDTPTWACYVDGMLCTILRIGAQHFALTNAVGDFDTALRERDRFVNALLTLGADPTKRQER